jgi:ATP:corrinoid adenosyltransferase
MSDQVSDMLKDLSCIETGSKFIFPSLRNKNKGITTNALLTAIRSLGIGSDQFVTHSMRGMASSFLHEKGFVSDVIERQLAHVETNKVKAAYCHAEYLEQRIVLMQAWSNYLDDLKSNVNLTKTIQE